MPRPPATFSLAPGSFWRDVLTEVRKDYQGAPREGKDADADRAAEEDELENVDRSDGWVDTCLSASADELFGKLRSAQQKRRAYCRLDLQLTDGCSSPSAPSTSLAASLSERVPRMAGTSCRCRS